MAKYTQLLPMVFVVHIFTHRFVLGIDCFNCMYNQNPKRVGYACVVAPNNVTSGAKSMPCPEKCSTFVQTIKESGQIFHITRGCAQKEPGCYEDAAYRYCVELCDGENCNEENKRPRKITRTKENFSTKNQDLKTKPTKGDTFPCYSCQFHEGAAQTCLTSPETLTYNNVVECPKGHRCNVFRQFDLARKVIRSFSRGCVPADHAHARDSCETDVNFETCSESCDRKLCNVGDGLKRGKMDSFAEQTKNCCIRQTVTVISLINAVFLLIISSK